METSILYCIKDPIPFLIIGGVSGIGKTSLLDYILENYSDFFEQPKSYTSREKRSDIDRYVFVSKEEMITLFENGELINLDHVHDDYYGISKNELIRIKRLNKIPIKEIHPKNFHKFPEKEHNTIRIIVDRKHDNLDELPFVQRENRPIEDIASFDCDFRINLSNLTIEESVFYLIKKTLAYKLHIDSHPHIKIIDEINKQGYNEIAAEFRDDSRITTKNFHDTSLVFWTEVFSKMQDFASILEIGFGNGWLFKNFSKGNKTVYGIDISEKMESNRHDKIIRTSSRNIPIKSTYFDYVVGSLIDPLLNYETFVETERLLKPNGLFAFTIPSKEWAIHLKSRHDVNKTTFSKKDGNEVNVYSFCNGVEILPTLLSLLNFKIIHVESYRLPLSYRGIVSKAIIDAAENCNQKAIDLPIITGVILQKTK